MKMRSVLLACGLLCAMPAQALDFSLHKKQGAGDGPTLLVIGGIQGDEPGGFNAASLLVTDYEIRRGRVWVVPNLNFLSIIKRSRGVYGDMNRKFADLQPSDPEYSAVQKIKAIIRDPQVDLVLNLHDGSGFYRPAYIDKLHNPRRWGQSIIIDQAELEAPRFGRLAALAARVAERANGSIAEAAHHFRVRNTRTRNGDREMEKTLTYYAIRQGKPAFGLEASKSFGTARRSWSHLLLLEAFMEQAGIEFERRFELGVHQVRQRIASNLQLALYEKRITLDMTRARKQLRYVPMRKDRPLQFSASNPLLAIVGERNQYRVRHGNRQVALLQPEYFEFDDSLQRVMLDIDGAARQLEFGTIVDVEQAFRVRPLPGYRVNVIGYRQPGLRDESGVTIRRQDIAPRFSIDRASRQYRIEFYRAARFCGMIVVNFRHPPRA